MHELTDLESLLGLLTVRLSSTQDLDRYRNLPECRCGNGKSVAHNLQAIIKKGH